MADVRLLADIHISPLTCQALRDSGYHVMRVADALSARASDREVVRFAQEQGLAILTQDLDFSALVAQSGEKGPSVITLRLGTPTPARAATILLNALPGLVPDLISGALVSVDERQVRVRPLPLE